LKNQLKIILILVCLLANIFYTTTLFAKPAQVVIVIDDMGYRSTDKQALTLPRQVTFAFLPHTPYGKKLALAAQAQKNDVLLHIPMEATNGKLLGPGALTSSMNQQEIQQSLAESFAEIPFAIGINNHMGSYLTQLDEPMIWTMKFLKARQLFFLDSLTSTQSKAAQVAKDIGVPVKARHIFLDNTLTDEYISRQFDNLIQYAKKNLTAIAIAHPHPKTVEMLTKLIPTLKKHNIELVPLSSLYIENKIARLSNKVSAKTEVSLRGDEDDE